MKNLILTTTFLFILSFSVLAQQDTSIQMTTALDNNFICPNKQDAYLYLNLNAAQTGKRVPLNISVVFDRSGSMEGERIHHGKKAIEYLIDQLQQMLGQSDALDGGGHSICHSGPSVLADDEFASLLAHCSEAFRVGEHLQQLCREFVNGTFGDEVPVYAGCNCLAESPCVGD